MKRLVYSPKAFVYVRTDAGVVNLSEYVVSGNVSRKIDQVSTAEVTIRNPHRRFTQAGNPTFRPMDAITIFLQRLPGSPVQVFTGYLDSTPYYQMYPGTATLTASCTLKRLQYTFFDPGLPFMRTFLNKYGWYPDGQGGIFKAEKKLDDPDTTNFNQVLTYDQRRDASVSELIFAVMKHIGGWTPETILVEQLPKSLLARVGKIYDELAKSNAEATEDFEDWLKDFLGTGSYGGPDGTLAGISLDSLDSEQSLALDAIMSMADQMNVSRRHRIAAIAAGLTESNLKNLNHGDADSVGIFQMRVGIWNTGKYAGYPDKPMLQARWFFDRAKDVDRNQSIGELCQAVEVSAYPDRYATNVDKATSLLEQYNAKKSDKDASESEPPEKDSDGRVGDRPYAGEQMKTGGKKKRNDSDDGKWVFPISKHAAYEGGVAGHMSRPLGNWQSDNAVDLMAPAGTKWIAVEDGTISTSQGWGDSSGSGQATVYGYRLHLEGESGNTYFYQHGASNIAPRGKKVKKGDVIGEIGDYASNGIPTHLHFAAKPPLNPEVVCAGGDVVAGSGSSGGGGDTSDDTSGATDALRAAKAGALLTTFNFPQAVDEAESMLLKGDKSLMNDQPLLPFMGELAKGSMRSFMSLPNGAFYAFHPDYFGSFNTKPYWEISDLEVLQGDIRLTDEALATHVYVVGDVYGSGIDITSKLQTRGVVTLLNAGNADFLNTDPGEVAKEQAQRRESRKKDDEKTLSPFLGDEQAVLDFLRRYGPRPYVEQATFIRSHVFETFYAFQTFMLMWSRQFLTPFTFTFMPELYPGGRVAFPGHGIGCYIDEVHHSFDYTNGFTTQANLSAPSALPNTTNQISKGMVRSGVLTREPGNAP